MARADGRIQAGQKLTTAISARSWNRALDAADIVLGDRQGFGVDPARATSAPYLHVSARNGSGSLVPRWGILGITGLYVTAAGNNASAEGNAQFQEMPVVNTAMPGTGFFPERWGVALEPIANNAFGRLAVTGVVQVKVRVINTGDRYVRALANNNASVVSGSHGEGMILYMEPGTGDNKWALIRLGVATGVAIVQFEGAWAINTTKTVTFLGGTDTVVALNRFASVGAAACTTRTGAITRHGNQWNLIAAQCQ